MLTQNVDPRLKQVMLKEKSRNLDSKKFHINFNVDSVICQAILNKHKFLLKEKPNINIDQNCHTKSQVGILRKWKNIWVRIFIKRSQSDIEGILLAGYENIKSLSISGARHLLIHELKYSYKKRTGCLNKMLRADKIRDFS